MPENWKKYKLGEVALLKRGYDLPERLREKGEYQIISSSGVTDTHIVYKVKGPGVITGRYGTIGKVFYTKRNFWPLNTSLYVKDFMGNDSKFIYYLLHTINWRSYSSKSAVPGIDRNEVHQEMVTLPPLQEQCAIASILSTLDDKIELNLQMNKTLEEMAMALYMHWFVDFGPFQNGKFVESELGMIPEGWEVKRLEEVLEIKYGKDHKKLEQGVIPVYGTGGIMRHVNQSLYAYESILIPRKGSLNNLYYLNKPFWTVDTLFYSKIKQEGFGKYAFHFLKTLDLASMDVGSAVPSLTTQLLNRIDIIIPPNKEVLKFDNSATIWFNTIQSNIEENQTLTILRDTLLPKLISGEVRVKDVEQMVETGL